MVALKQTKSIDSKPALIQRVRLSLSGNPCWTSLGQDPSRAKDIARLKDLERRLAKIPTVKYGTIEIRPQWSQK